MYKSLIPPNGTKPFVRFRIDGPFRCDQGGKKFPGVLIEKEIVAISAGKKTAWFRGSRKSNGMTPLPLRPRGRKSGAERTKEYI
jgi:hypothetical protein